MTASDPRSQLNQKIDRLPPGIMGVVSEFVDFLLLRHEKNLPYENQDNQTTDIPNTIGGREAHQDSNNIRHAKGNGLLELESGWEGDDFEECLQSVYDTRTQIKA